MRVSFISPASMIEEFGNKGDFHLTLSHLIGNPDLKSYEFEIRKSGLPIILDNGLFENSVAESLESLLDKAQSLNAEYVFLPDVIYDREGTEEAAIQAIEHIKQREHFTPKLAAVVQANNPQDFIESYKIFAQMDAISLIGLSILSIPNSWNLPISDARLQCLIELKKLADSGFKMKDSHLLGAGDHYRDVEYAALYCPWVVSHDSSSAVWNGVDYRRISDSKLEVQGGKTPKHVDFFYNQGLDTQQVQIINENINVVLNICHPK